MTKSAVRAEARERLRRLDPAEREEQGERIARLVWSLPEMRAARVILLYASLPMEVPTDAIAEEAWRRGVEVTYPRCLPPADLTLHQVRGLAELREEGSFGIREPAPACRLTAPDEVDVALLPGLAWDRSGTRLGRGAGYYDRLLADPRFRAHRAGLFFAVQEFPTLPSDPWDQPIHSVVTEKEIVNF